MYFEVYDVMKHMTNISLIRNDFKNKNGTNTEGKHARIYKSLIPTFGKLHRFAKSRD